MTKQLMILRHGKSDFDSVPGGDFERPLNARGERQAMLIGNWMQTHGIVPDVILSSTALRARQTTERVCDAAKFLSTQVVWQDELYLAELETLLKMISMQLAYKDKVLVVGHNPGLEDLLRFLCEDDLETSKNSGLFSTATLAQVDLSDCNVGLKPLCGKLIRLISASEIENRT